MTDNRESLMGYLKTCLEAITTGNGYNFSVALVTRKRKDLQEVNDLPCVMILDADVEHEKVGDDFDRVWLRVALVGYLKSDDPETDINYLARDIEKAVTIRAEAPHRQMSNVASPTITTAEPLAEDGEGYVRIELEYYYTEDVDA